MEPLTVSVKNACQALGIGRTKAWQLIGNQSLATVKVGKRTMVKVDSIRQLVDAA